MRTDVDPQVEHDTDTRQSDEWVLAADDGGQWSVIIHNDDITPMDFVVHVLRSVFELSYSLAEAVMLTAHYTGMAHVVTLSREEAKYRVGQAHGAARAAGYPLTFTIEPEQ
jgi:ATP-dependent Clp protease adaptor protein ClpS